LPVLSVAELPFFSPTYEEARKVADAVRPIINRELEQKFKSKILINFTFDPQQIYCNKRIAKLEDFKGVKIRVWGAEPAELLKAWGAAPVFMSSAEVYTALQHKTVDGAITGYFTCYTFNWPDVVKYCNMWNWAITPSLFVVMNTEAFNRLPKDVQKIVLDAAQKIEEKGWKVAPGVSDELKGKLQAKGMEMVSVPASEREKGAKFAPAVWETWEKHGGPVCSEAMKAALKAIGR
jgi:TRAP-type C4-dicarboxylate transport system substrate-binding protein